MYKTPLAIRSATALWATAVIAAIVETLLVVIPIVSEGSAEAGLWVNAGVRTVVYITATLLIVNLARGRAWARIALTLLLGILGLGSMVIPPALEMIEGQSFVQAFGGGGSLGSAFLVVRLVHIVSVIAATALMFTPRANAYLTRRSETTPMPDDRTLTAI